MRGVGLPYVSASTLLHKFPLVVNVSSTTVTSVLAKPCLDPLFIIIVVIIIIITTTTTTIPRGCVEWVLTVPRVGVEWREGMDLTRRPWTHRAGAAGLVRRARARRWRSTWPAKELLRG